MQCKNHPDIEALDRCVGCAEAFCENCLVAIKGQKHCADCKHMAVTRPPSISEEGSIPCKEAAEALTYAILGIFCFGIILGPIAISKANKAKMKIAADPRLTGSGKATAATIIGVLVLVLWVLGMLARVAKR
jgi:hypothetical protein